MGRIDAIISDELEAKLRMQITKRFGGKKGDLVKAIDEAVHSWIEQTEFERSLNNLKRHCRPMGKTVDDEKFNKIIRSIRDDASNIDIKDQYVDQTNITPEEIREYEKKIKKNLSELGNILTGECKEKYLEDFKNSINEIIKKQKK
ncbi:MAG TPA: ribbon-helix-helix domain-containing protein [Candidatus Methanoperedens sp.]